jgi:ABC-2 type transport system permease protein
MRKALDITLNDLRLFFRSRGNVVGLVIVPVTLTLVVGVFLPTGDGEDARLRVDVVDHDASRQSVEFLDTLRRVNGSLVLCPMDNDAEDVCNLGDEFRFDTAWATQRVQESDSLAMIEIPAGFGARVQAFEPVEILYLSDETFTAPGFIRQAVAAAIQRVNGAVVASRVGTDVAQELGVVPAGGDGRAQFVRGVYERAAALWDEDPVRVTYELTAQDVQDANSGSTAGFGQSVPGMGTMYAMFTVFGGMIGLVGERKLGTLQRLVVMPVTRAQLLGGKILSRLTLGLIQYLVVFAVGFLVGLEIGDPLALLMVMLSFLLAATAFSFALGTRLQTEAQANGLANLLGLTLAPLGGAWWPLEIVPPFMRVIGHASPVAWAMDGFQALIFENGGVGDVLLPVVVLLLFAVVCFGIGIRRFRYV